MKVRRSCSVSSGFFFTANSFTASPERSSGTPTTAHSSTPPCFIATSSTSLGNTLKPDTEIMSFLRSTMAMRPCFHDADVAGAEVAVGGHHQRGLLGTPPVAGHHLRSARADFAALAERHVGGVIVADSDIGRGQR